MLWSWFIIFQQKNKRIWCTRKISISNHRRSRKQRWLNFFGNYLFCYYYCLHHFLFLHQACWSYQYVGCMSYMNLVYCMTKSWVLRSSVVGASDQCLEGLRFIPVEESDFSLSCSLDMLITSFLKNINMLF